MPTRGRRDFVPQALQYWRAQTIESELIIVDDADDRSFPDGITEDRITYHVLDRRHTIGAKRNMACSFASGEFLCHVDSDDYYAPVRLAHQLEILEASGKAVTGYRSAICTNGKDWWKYNGHQHNCLGASLFYKRVWWKQHPFEKKQVGEDVAFTWTAVQHKEFHSIADAGDMFIFRIHADNTSKKNPASRSNFVSLACPTINPFTACP